MFFNGSQKFKFSDEVIARIAQIIQEAMLFGIDAVDIMRQVEVTTGIDGSYLVLTPDYKKFVEETHEKLTNEAETLRKELENDGRQLRVSNHIHASCVQFDV